MNILLDTLLHRVARVPYFLHVRHKRIKLTAKETYVFIHGLGDTADLWAGVISRLPANVNYIAMDLVGFGDSPKPSRMTYGAKVQARSVLRTCLASGLFGPVTVVGHSLGALVSVEFAKRYPLTARRLVLCSPPIYDTSYGRKTKNLQQGALRRLYAELPNNPGIVVNAYAFGKKVHAVNQSLQVTPETLPAFLSSLQASIVNQDTMKLIEKIKVPIVIINGQFDVLTVGKVLQSIVAKHQNMQLVTIPTAHTINNFYEQKIIEVLQGRIHKKRNTSRGTKGVSR